MKSQKGVSLSLETIITIIIILVVLIVIVLFATGTFDSLLGVSKNTAQNSVSLLNSTNLVAK